MARKTKGYLLFPRAEHDLESIFAYTVEHWSRRQARAYLAELTVAFQALAAGTRVGRDAELGHRVMKLPVGSHVVFYRMTASAVEIVRVLHQAMDAPRHLDR
jgi:toxin ParE1/3/4